MGCICNNKGECIYCLMKEPIKQHFGTTGVEMYEQTFKDIEYLVKLKIDDYDLKNPLPLTPESQKECDKVLEIANRYGVEI